MESKIGRNVWRMIFLAILLCAFMALGCARSKQAVAPTGEEKKETSQAAPAPETEKEKAPTPSASVAGKSAPPAEPKGAEAGKKAPPSAPQSSQDPIASGSVLLNPALPHDAQMIQARLTELGFYKAAVDGIWGKGSRAALKAFKGKNGLPFPDKWDKDTQVLLFQGTAQNAPQSQAPSRDAIESGEVLLNPAQPQDAQMIQSRLAEMGLYKAAIDGIWGKGSEAALKVFKEKNSLSNPGSWDKETQMLLFK